MKARVVLCVAVAMAALAFAGCGGGGSSIADPATIAPPGSPLFVDASVRPQGDVKSNVDALAKNVAGISDPELIVSKLDSSLAESSGDLSYARDVEPWLGEKAGIFFEHFDGNNFSGVGAIVQTTDTGATRNFIDKLSKADGDVRNASYEGVDYKVKSSDGSALGLVGDFLVFGEDEQAFKDAVDASKGDSLADDDTYSKVISTAPDGSLADVYADIGGLLKQAGTAVNDQTLQTFKAIGADPSDATALASVVPGSDQVEIDLSTDAAGGNAPTGSGADLLGTFPADSVAAFAASDFGKQLTQAIDGIDASGIPPQVPPHQLKSTLGAAGIDLDNIAGSIGDAGLFAEGTDMSSLDGALVLTMSDSKAATQAIANIGLLLRHAGTPGITAVTGKASGFSVHNSQLGRNSIVVVAKGERIAVGYGLSAALQGLASDGSGATLSDSATYKAAVDALGGTPISGFVDAPSALDLAQALGAGSNDPKFEMVRPYLEKAQFLAAGTGKQGDLATTKVIVGFSK